jgi:hypothetical protein
MSRSIRLRDLSSPRDLIVQRHLDIRQRALPRIAHHSLHDSPTALRVK